MADQPDGTMPIAPECKAPIGWDCQIGEVVEQGGIFVASGGLCVPADPIWTPPQREFYGLDEIAVALHRKPKKVAKWYRKGRLPTPTDVLATGPIWSAADITEFLYPKPATLRDVLPRFSAERGGIRYVIPPKTPAR